jgi:hypothetical protein
LHGIILGSSTVYPLENLIEKRGVRIKEKIPRLFLLKITQQSSLLPSLSANTGIMAASSPSLLVFSLFVADGAFKTIKNSPKGGGGLEPIPMTARRVVFVYVF